MAAQDPELGETAGPAQTAPRKRAKKRNDEVAQAETPASDEAERADGDTSRWGAAASYGNTPARARDEDWERPPSSGGDSDDREAPKGDTDHDVSVRSFSLGLLGVAELPVGVGDPVNAPGGSRAVNDTLTAPVIGSRFWFTSRVGVDLGFGFMMRSGTIERGDTSNDGAKAMGWGLQVGVPFSLAYGKHYNVLLIPHFGYGTSSATDTRNTAEDADDIFGKGTLIEGGLKAGVETQLGAIGLPGLALQLSVGLRVRMEQRTANVPVLDDAGVLQSEYEIDSNTTTVTTSPGSSLGSAVAGTLSALYYF